MFLFTQAWILVLCFPDARANRKTVLKARCFREAFLRGSKGALVSWCKTRDRFQEGISVRRFGLSLWKLHTYSRVIANLISYGSSVTKYGGGLKFPFLEHVEKEFSYLVYRWCFKQKWSTSSHRLLLLSISEELQFVLPLDQRNLGLWWSKLWKPSMEIEEVSV